MDITTKVQKIFSPSSCELCIEWAGGKGGALQPQQLISLTYSFPYVLYQRILQKNFTEEMISNNFPFLTLFFTRFFRILIQ